MLFRAIAGASLAGAAVLFALINGPLWTVPVLFAALFLGLCMLALGFLWLVCAVVDLQKPQETDSPFYRAVMYVYIEALMNLVLVRLRTQGLEKTPKAGRFLLVCNHLHLADPGIVHHCFRKSQLAFITKLENYRMPFVGKFMHKTLCQGLDRDNDRAALKTILKCIQLIQEDQASVAVFPEGYTSRDGLLHPFRPGVFKIAQRTKVPIVVCTLQGTRDIFHNLKKLRPTPVQLHLVRVISPEEYEGMGTAQISSLVYETMILDLGEGFRP